MLLKHTPRYPVLIELLAFRHVRTRSLKPGKIVILLHGRFAGRKAVILSNQDGGTSKHSYGHCIVAGVDKSPRKVTKKMKPKKIAKRTKIATFVKVVNYNHLMPTRYTLDVESIKPKVDMEAFSNPVAASEKPEARTESRTAVAKEFQNRFNAGKNKWFFTPLRF